MDKIIFFHMNQLGDLLFSMPVLKAAKRELNVQIYSVVPSPLSLLLTSSKLADATLPKDKCRIKDIRKEKFDKAVLFSQSPKSLIFAYFSRIKERIGFETSSLSFLLTKKAPRTGVPSLFNNNNLGLAMGLKTIQEDYANILNIPKNYLDGVKKWFKENNLDFSKTIAISINASKKRQNKCLKANKWVELIDVLSDKGFSCVLSGTKWEKESLNKIAKQCKVLPKLFTADNGILDSGAFFKLSSLFIGVDSGPMHLAAAVGTKCIGLFGRTDPFQIGPMSLEKHVVIKKDDISQITTEEIVSKISF